MTVVLAKRFGSHIEVVADTTISDRDRGREDAFPGRLKIITLSPSLAIAYAGHSDPALHIIRDLFRRGTVRVGDVLRELQSFTASEHHEVEFLVATSQRQNYEKCGPGRSRTPWRTVRWATLLYDPPSTRGLN